MSTFNQRELVRGFSPTQHVLDKAPTIRVVTSIQRLFLQRSRFSTAHQQNFDGRRSYEPRQKKHWPIGWHVSASTRPSIHAQGRSISINQVTWSTSGAHKNLGKGSEVRAPSTDVS